MKKKVTGKDLTKEAPRSPRIRVGVYCDLRRLTGSTTIWRSASFFNEEVKKLGLDPAKTTTFEWLELDDRVSHAQAAA
jgi:hypothetical protein